MSSVKITYSPTIHIAKKATQALCIFPCMYGWSNVNTFHDYSQFLTDLES